ncbi:MAG: nitrate reductase associated protein [Cyanobium sp.]
MRRRLDLAGFSLKLQHWNALTPEERTELPPWPDDPGAIDALRERLLRRAPELSPGQGSELARPTGEPWHQSECRPAVPVASCDLRDLDQTADAWAGLDELQRFALVRLSHPGHDHRNLPRGLQDFGLRTGGPA